jgi:hypothetical protein
MRVVVLLVLLVLMSITPPTLAVTATTATTTVVSSSSSSSSGSECDPSYPDVCIPSPPPDLACSDISERRFEVVGSDPHALDGDNNGIACEGPPLPVPPIPLQAQQQQEAQEQQEQNQTETQNLPTSTTTSFITNATTKTDGLLTASINDTRFTTDQIISIDGTLAGGDGAGAGAADGTVFIELRDPHNQALLYDSTNMTTTGTSVTPFSYSLVAGKLLENAGGDAAGDNRRVVKPMNETGSNYTLLVGYDGGTGDVTSPSIDDITTTTTSEVQFVFAYDHVLDAEEAAATTTAPASERGSPSDVPPPRQPPRVSPPAEEEDREPTTPTRPTTTLPSVDEQEERLEEQEELIDDQQSRIEDLEDEQSRLEELLEEAREDEGEDAEGRLQELLDEQEERADDDDDDDDSRDALEILKDVLNREPPRDVDEDDD